MIDQKFLESLGVTDESTVQKIAETYTADIKAEQDAATATKTQLDEANKTIQMQGAPMCCCMEMQTFSGGGILTESFSAVNFL